MAKKRVGKKIVAAKKVKPKFNRSVKKRGVKHYGKKLNTTADVSKINAEKSTDKKLSTGVLTKRQTDHKEHDTPQPKRQKFAMSTLTRKEEKKKKLVRRRERKVPLESQEKIKHAKQIWERVRRHDMEKMERDILITELMNLIKLQVYELALKHDTARIIQCVLKYGSEDMRTVIFEKLKDHVMELSKMKYAKFTIKALFKYCTPTQRGHMMSCFYNHVPTLVRHKEAVELVELAYNDYANVQQRSLLVQEFYGPQFALFKDGSGQSLGDILSANPEQRTKLIGHMKQALMPLLDKNLLRHSIVHYALLEFVLHADDISKAEMIESLREVAVEMLHTREGAKINLHCLWHGTAKDRKIYIKSLKNYVTKICKEEHGHLVLLGVFDCVDDTVLVTKNILVPMMSSLEELCEDKHGRRVLLYLLSPRSPQHFSQQFLQLLTPGDNNQHSKKPQTIRWEELLTAISPPLINLAAEKAIKWAYTKPLAPLLIQTVQSAKGDVTPIYSSLCENLKLPYKEEGHLAADPCGHWVLKKLIGTTREDTPLLGDIITQTISDAAIQSWSSTNRGCFVLSSMVVSCHKSKEVILEILRPVVEELRTMSTKSEGAKVLLKTIEESLN